MLFTVRRKDLKNKETEDLVEMVLIPSALPRFLRVPGEEAIYIGIENLITRFAEHLFPGFEMRGSGVFRCGGSVGRGRGARPDSGHTSTQ